MIEQKFTDCEDIIREKIVDKNFLFDYHKKLISHLQFLFHAQKTAPCCFLDTEYTCTVRVSPYNIRTFQVEEIIDQMVEI